MQWNLIKCIPIKSDFWSHPQTGFKWSGVGTWHLFFKSSSGDSQLQSALRTIALEYLLSSSVLILFLIHRPKFPAFCWASQPQCSIVLHFLNSPNQTHVPNSVNLFLYVDRDTVFPFSEAGDLEVIFKNSYCSASSIHLFAVPCIFYCYQYQIHSPTTI